MPAVQVLQIPLGPDAQSHRPALTDLARKLRDTKGIESSLCALQHENKQVGGLSIVWNDLASQEAWENSSAGAKTRAQLQLLASGETKEDVVVFTEDPQPVWTAKVTEIVSWIYPSSDLTDAKRQDIEAGSKKVQQALSKAPGIEGGMFGGWGQKEFDHNGVPSRRWTCLLGWQSVQAHDECRETPLFTENVHWLMDSGHTGIEMVHFPLSQSR